jgi:hypothetical protein
MVLSASKTPEGLGKLSVCLFGSELLGQRAILYIAD